MEGWGQERIADVGHLQPSLPFRLGQGWARVLVVCLSVCLWCLWMMVVSSDTPRPPIHPSIRIPPPLNDGRRHQQNNPFIYSTGRRMMEMEYVLGIFPRIDKSFIPWDNRISTWKFVLVYCA